MSEPPKLTLEDLVSIQPGLARLMPEIGARMWKCYYAAQAGNWENAAWQLREMRKLFALCITTRPKYANDITAYLSERLDPLVAAVERGDKSAFEQQFGIAVDSANQYHATFNKPWIRWKLPATAPPDLDFTPTSPDSK